MFVILPSCGEVLCIQELSQVKGSMFGTVGLVQLDEVSIQNTQIFFKMSVSTLFICLRLQRNSTNKDITF